jgi:hypothetical protein
MDRILGLFKFGARAYIDDLVRGTPYMNSLHHFSQLEAEKQPCLRNDSFEGVGRLIRADGAMLSIQVEGGFQLVGLISGPIQWRPEDGIKANLFWSNALREPAGPQFVDPLP